MKHVFELSLQSVAERIKIFMIFLVWSEVEHSVGFKPGMDFNVFMITYVIKTVYIFNFIQVDHESILEKLIPQSTQK